MVQQGEHEPLKATVHFSLGLLMATCAVYNGWAWARRRERHLWVNAGLYAMLTAWEATHVWHHLTGADDE